jgi:HD domain
MKAILILKLTVLLYFQQSMPEINSSKEALELLIKLKAPFRLVQHHLVVLEAANILVKEIKIVFPKLVCDYQLVLIGTALHDAGKILYPKEISVLGKKHEIEGEKFLIEKGVKPEIARFCRTHAQWDKCYDCKLKDLLVALADNLWKGKRFELLEEKIVSNITDNTNSNYWQNYLTLNNIYELITDKSETFLLKSLDF